jgi:glycosyltransferase involved in cell wall biosynthesis
MTRRSEESARALRIAMVAPLHESVPPKLYGGTERVVSYLTEELVKMGHDVTLFGSGDSVTRARLRAPVARGLRLEGCHDPHAPHFSLLHDLAESAADFDLVHFHIEYLHFPLSRALGLTNVTTLHGRLDMPELGPLFRRYDDMPLVSISRSQRAPLAFANWVATVHHGLPPRLLPLTPAPGKYLAFLGRISPEKGPVDAIGIARRLGVPLRIAAKIDEKDREYFEATVKPLLGGDVQFVGEIDDREKARFLGDAAALLCPIAWPEPFGLVMIESMACGTPVLAYRFGSAPELVHEGVNGWLASDLDEAVAKLQALGRFDRVACRRHFESHFTAERMARDYVAVYRGILESPREPIVPLPRRGDEARDTA